MAKKLMKGCEALGEAAIRAGCKHFFGYPITPQTEVPEYLSKRLPEVGGVYVQAESEVAASNMIYGCAATGVRVFTSTSSPGVSLMSETVSYMAGAETPVVIINIMRGSPGLGGIHPSQSDYFQATRGIGHGDIKVIVLGPSSVQEAVDLMIDAFDLADKYRNPVMVIGDGIIGQMMEPVEFKERPPVELPEKTWAACGAKGGRPSRHVHSLYLDPAQLEQHNFRLQKKYAEIEANEARHELYNCEEPYDILVVSYGTTARICKTSIDLLKEEGINVGLVRPITLYPYPYKAVREAMNKAKSVMVVELSAGQMIEDVKLAMDEKRPLHFYGRIGGMVPSPEEVVEEIKKIIP
ncbi:MAG: 3-methyl-2-oxobutanoate dehydrogenase subunit VorB [Planctomycetes bacterium]|jgi:2-oxoglutarate ferredoxin oxidoreductase subunit alpha|nr:3-methyl-2-oxobutanoate dehydrogenase subunit VorB [Planctomycetota bacterium]HON45532.1 3-methyl-2-oxobutanoate dehydrogenase subunit VorB [Planctomycetota bacterium]HPY75423.1 3-methyl-2-oxobutanoate dehydrogenase subunit VorB [Planctomycetota bacterium]HQB01036.1 3-methyl-2-oxobutanoate dehydrogenase subunit VorB [Planctomycetota bacterium]HRU51727.1 3-methyl-2-oxobutanoate dehydrogenase subunit VorB [Planctomycetota bacterium]